MINYQKVWAGLAHEEKIAFRDRAIKAVQEIYPHYIVRPVEPGDADRFFVGNKQDNVRVTVPLRDLFARFSITGKTHEDLKDAIFNEYAGMLNMAEDVSVATEIPEFTWDDVKGDVRLQHVRLNEIPEGKLHYPFGDEVVTALVIDRPEQTIMYWITQEMLDSWGKTMDELFKQSMENLTDLSEGIEIVGTNTPRKELWPEKGQPFVTTCLLLSPLRYLIAQTIGSPFRFGIPSRHRFYAWIDIEDENYQIEMKAKMEREMDRYPSALTSKIYEVDTQGQIKLVKPQPEIPPVPFISNN
ncbi:MAG: hypothetical protein IPL32_03970 [Chloracidobacterium sp.]|nr:hypothetical protein [Chloracidobacterium sp.]